MVFYNQKMLAVQQGYLKLNPAYTDPILKDFGTMPVQIDKKNNYVQWDGVFGLGARVKKADGLVFPEQGDVKFDRMLRKAKWFNSIIKLDELTYKAFSQGSEEAVAKVQELMQDIEWKFAQDPILWFFGYGNNFLTDPDVDPDWKPWFKAPAADGNGTMEDPIPFNELVVPDGGAAGTPETALAFAVNMSGTNQTVNFAQKLLGPIVEGALKMKDANTGKQLLKSQSSSDPTSDVFRIYLHPLVIARLKRTACIDSDKRQLNKSLLQDIEQMGFVVMPYKDLTYSYAEDGVIQFIVVVNPKDNFMIGIPDGMTVEGFYEESQGGQKSYIQRYYERLCPGVRPYRMEITAGTEQYFAAWMHGTFVYMDDA